MDEVKRCPYCAEEILAVAIKCRHCGSAVDGAVAAVKKQFTMSPTFKILGVVIVAIFAASWLYNLSSGKTTILASGFDDAEIERVKESIRTEYGKEKGVAVVGVELIKESPKKLSGFVKVKIPLFGEVTKPCTATMGDGNQYLWQCQ